MQDSRKAGETFLEYKARLQRARRGVLEVPQPSTPPVPVTPDRSGVLDEAIASIKTVLP